MYIGEIIKKYRIENKLSQRAFASKTSLSPSYINTLEKIYNPKNNRPYSITMGVAIEISKAMEITVEELLYMLDNNHEDTFSSTKIKKIDSSSLTIPILKTIKSDYNYMSEDNWDGTINISSTSIKSFKNYFGYTIKDDSMSPILIKDDIVIIQKQDTYKTGDIVLTIISNDECIIRKVIKNSNTILLQSFNSNYEPLMYTYDEIDSIPVIIVGIVKQLKRNF